MKTKVLSKCVLSLSCLICLLSCSSNSSKSKINRADVVYTSTPLFDLSNPASSMSYQTTIEGKIESIKIGRNDITIYDYSDGILTLSGEELKNVAAGEKSITIKTDKKTYKNDVMICTKIITTAQEFQDINNNLSGIYVLGSDIDLSSIDNFEPLGYFFGDEQNIKNEYFHGILDGNGYTIKNASVKYSLDPASNESNYKGNPMFVSEAHSAGDNIGIFQIIGSSGIVRNTVFKDCIVSARTIGGIIAGNCSGTIENCLIDGGSVNISTHFWDDDCNTGSIAGICAGGASITNVISTGEASIQNIYVDWSDDYVGQVAEHGEHASDDDPNWKFYGSDKVVENSTEKSLDSNGMQSNGVYSGVGKIWGSVSSCYSLAYEITPYEGETRDVCFGQTHLGENKSSSGDSDMGEMVSCYTKTEEELKSSDLYSSFDTTIWNIKDNKLPNIKAIYPTL